MSSSPPTVSWLVTVKNGMPYLREMLASIEAQTYRDFEVLVWLVESSDGTADELERWIPRRLPGTIFRSGPLGLGAARAELVRRARSEFCACIDADDVNEAERLAHQVSYLQQHPTIALVGSAMQEVDPTGAATGAIYCYPAEHEDIEHTFLVQNCIGHSAAVFRRESVLSVGNYDDTAPIEDLDLWLRLAEHHRLSNLSTRLVKYRVHRSSHSHQVGFDHVNMRAVETLARHAPKLFGLGADETRLLRQRKLRSTIGPIRRIAKHLARRRGTQARNILRWPSLVDSIRFLTPTNDHVSRLFLGYVDPRPMAFRHAAHEARNAVIQAMPFGRRVLESVRKRRRSAPC